MWILFCNAETWTITSKQHRRWAGGDGYWGWSGASKEEHAQALDRAHTSSFVLTVGGGVCKETLRCRSPSLAVFTIAALLH